MTDEEFEAGLKQKLAGVPRKDAVVLLGYLARTLDETRLEHPGPDDHRMLRVLRKVRAEWWEAEEG